LGESRDWLLHWTCLAVPGAFDRQPEDAPERIGIDMVGDGIKHLANLHVADRLVHGIGRALQLAPLTDGELPAGAGGNAAGIGLEKSDTPDEL
jgi:hypothetical protein